jgi:hypothetical protein
VTPDLFALAEDATTNRPRIARRAQDVHDHSMLAHEQELSHLSKRAAQVLSWLRDNGPHTDREVMRGMGYADMNAVRPRITELVDARLLVEVGERIDSETRKRVRIVAWPGFTS